MGAHIDTLESAKGSGRTWRLPFLNWILSEYAFLAYIVVAVFLSIFDIIEDFEDKLPLSHIYHEIFLVGVYLFGLLFLIQHIRKKNNKFSKIINVKDNNIKKLTEENLVWREKWIEQKKQISQMLQEEFSRWQLTPAEQDVAKLLLKGLGIKDIANLRERAEKTVRLQCQSIYKKSNLSGRAEFSAYFLEDLFDTSF